MSITSGSGGPFVAPPGPTPAQQPVSKVPPTGVPKINGTQTYLAAQTPNDGQVHPYLVHFTKIITVTEVGGSGTITYTLGGVVQNVNQDGGNATPGTIIGTSAIMCDPNTPILVKQFAALTGGASVVYTAIELVG